MNNLFAFLPMQDSADLVGQPEQLRERLAEDGYLYFRQVIDRQKLRDLRGDMIHALAQRGWVDPPAVPITGVCRIPPLREDTEEYQLGYDAIQRLERFHGLAHEPELIGIVRDVLGESAFPHPLKVARLSFPDNYEASTPPHQDYPNNQGTPSLTAAWIPVWDMTPEFGGLAILRGSHRYGVLPVARHLGAGNRCSVLPDHVQEACRWVTTEFRMGDVLLFPSMTVHASLHNASQFHMRLSVDFRYQLEGEALTEGCLQPHFQRLSWEEIYAGWRSDEHQYYWRDLDFEVVPFEEFPLVGHEVGAEFTSEQRREIYYYEERAAARTARRLEALAALDEGGDAEGGRPRRRWSSWTGRRRPDADTRAPEPVSGPPPGPPGR